MASHRVFWLVVGDTFERQLHEVAVALAVSALRLGATGWTLYQAGVFDVVIQTMLHHRIIPVYERFEVILLPDQKAALPTFLQGKAQAGVVAFILQTSQTPPTALKANAASFAQADPIEGAVGTTGQRLGKNGVQMLSDPGDTQP